MKEDYFTKLYREGINKNFYGRYLRYEKVQDYLEKLPEAFHVKRESQSVLDRPIYSVQIGSGKTRVLIWSQMHGNETTCTKAVLDFLNCIERDSDLICEILRSCTLKIIPILNPDGAVAYTRKNANNVDLNRDALRRSQPEMRYLQDEANHFKPDFCFNMHDQRTLFGFAKEDKPATLSFLAPAANTTQDVTHSRKQSMQIIAGINQKLKAYIPDQIGRYDDTFNPNCIGDFFQAKGIPTILFEAGHFPEDYNREKTRQFVFIAFCEALKLISTKNETVFTVSSYFRIPENTKSFFDVLVRNVKIGHKINDIGIQYEEKLLRNTIKFIPKIAKIQNLSQFHGHYEIDAKQQKITILPDLNMEKGRIVEEMVINHKKFPLDLTNN